MDDRTVDTFLHFSELAKLAGVDDTDRQFRKYLRGEGQVAQYETEQRQKAFAELEKVRAQIEKSKQTLHKRLK